MDKTVKNMTRLLFLDNHLFLSKWPQTDILFLINKYLTAIFSFNDSISNRRYY